MKYYESANNIFPVVDNGESIMLIDLKSGAKLEKQTERLIKQYVGGVDAVRAKLKNCPAKNMEEMRVWYDSMLDAQARMGQAMNDLKEAERKIEMLKHRVKNYSYAEMEAIGCTWVVNIGCEYLMNPKTGNEFFSEEDAKALYQEQVEARKEEIERNEWEEDVHYYVEKATEYLDDCVRDEENGAFDDDRSDFYLYRSPEYRKFHDAKKGDFLLSVLNFYLAFSGNPNVENFEIHTCGMHNGKKKEYLIKGDDQGNFEVVRTDKKRS